jgi:glycosyltransferase involved in cell wall biosynthesis
MKILHLAAANRWTGAAAPAFAEVEALRAAGIDAHYAYVGGYKLEQKLADCEFAHPLILKAQNPVAFWRSVQALAGMGRPFDVVHAHLTYDHWLARFLTRVRPAIIARTFHSRRALRNDPFARSLLSRTAAAFVINDALASAPALRGRDVTVTPPPLDQRLFSPRGGHVRAAYRIDPGTPLIAVIGKLSPDRGFEDALRTFAHLRERVPEARMMVIGHGPHRTPLESLAHDLGVAGEVMWAGYHEDDLPDHYRAADALLFTAAGSDEGHRAVIEAMGCGVPPVTYPIEGMAGVLGPLTGRLMAPAPSPAALAATVTAVLAAGTSLKEAAAERAGAFSFPASSRRLLEGYARVMQRTFL